jgi:hypothetical protein
MLAVRRVFAKRHLYEHSGGTIDQKHVENVPEDAHLLGQKAELSLDEFRSAAQAIRRVLDAVVGATEP